MNDLFIRTKITLSKFFTNIYDTNTLKSKYEKSMPNYYRSQLI